MSTYLFSNVSPINTTTKDIAKRFNMELIYSTPKLNVLVNTNMLVNIDKQFIKVYITKQSEDVGRIEKYFYE